MGDTCHLKLNMSKRPIANKYREGKMKRTLKRESKVREIVIRETILSAPGQGASRPAFHGWPARRPDPVDPRVLPSTSAPRRLRSAGEGPWVGGTRRRLSGQAGERGWAYIWAWSVNLSRHQRCGADRPVLKHGPRSATLVQVIEWQTQGRNESKLRRVGPTFTGDAPRPGPNRWFGSR
jgi:hypothetical protein